MNMEQIYLRAHFTWPSQSKPNHMEIFERLNYSYLDSVGVFCQNTQGQTNSGICRNCFSCTKVEPAVFQQFIAFLSLCSVRVLLCRHPASSCVWSLECFLESSEARSHPLLNVTWLIPDACVQSRTALVLGYTFMNKLTAVKPWSQVSKTFWSCNAVWIASPAGSASGLSRYCGNHDIRTFMLE